jgi:hypothetical protein
VKPQALHHRQPFAEHRIRDPEVEVGRLLHDMGDGKCCDLVEGHRRITGQPAMLGRDFAGAVLEPPRRIGEDGVEALSSEACEKIVIPK